LGGLLLRRGKGKGGEGKGGEGTEGGKGRKGEGKERAMSPPPLFGGSLRLRSYIEGGTFNVKHF